MADQPEPQLTMPTRVKRAHRNHDYPGLFPAGVMPTGDIDLLRADDGSILVVKSYEFGRKMPGAHDKLWKALVRFGSQEQPPGSIAVVCVWGLGQTPREYILYDHMGRSEPKAASLEDWRGFLRGWWLDHGGRP